MKLAVFQESRVGGRASNQDRVLLTHTSDAVLMVVADGMGGHLQGEVAAQITVDLLGELFHQQAVPKLQHPNRFLINAISAAHQAILDYAVQHRLPEIPCTTVVVALIQDDMLFWCHVGDSRLYVLDQNGLRLRSRDHSQVQRMIDQGMLTEEGALVHPERNKIYNCLGATQDPDIDIGERQFLSPGVTVMMCSDGLWSQVGNEELQKVFARRHVGQVMPALMTVAERRAGAGGDNLSAVAVTLLDPAVDIAHLPGMLDTARMPAKLPRPAVDPTVETMHREILASLPPKP
ncbi:PP2C family protein-serine/threonine phosphatase [Gulbenkiania mobilis]|uniref:PP2C family protein-serine/threonine phosphatase n=1 Tax=Gulbenkiania mobilis TaxID=397457 RepID=UPI0006BBA230|nr:protein phosphatase 2C domain-containing protein [Gulbenkiania mobilis]